MTGILDRVGLGRFWEWLKVKISRIFHVKHRRRVTEGHLDQERETEVSLGLMAQAATNQTPEQQIFLSQSLHGMRQRVGHLRGAVPNRSLAEERELATIEAWLATHEGRETPRPRGLLGPLATANPLLGLLTSPVAWAVIAFTIPAAWGAVTSARLHHAKADLVDVRHDLARAVGERDGWKRLYEGEHRAVIDAQQASAATAANLEDERRRSRTARRREQERNRAIQSVLVNDQPPAWRLRDDQPLPERPAAADSGAADRAAGLPR